MTPLAYRPEIDGLRAIAVAAVVLYHADPSLLPGGFVGVDVFFVISGYLITALLAREWQARGRIDFAAFYARRVRRLLPALVALVLGVMALLVLVLGRNEALVQQAGSSGAASLLMVANFYFQAQSGGYFDEPAAAMPFLHLWSLSVEEQFYLVYPAVLLLLLRLVPGGVTRRLVLLAVASLLLAEYWAHILPQRAFYQMPARFWELAAGALIALSAVPDHRGRLTAWCLPAGLLLMAWAFVYTPAWGSFPGLGALPATLGACGVLLGIHRGAPSGLGAGLLRARPMVGLGLISYSLYLWHWPLLVIDGQAGFEAASSEWRLLVCLFAIVPAWLSWRFVELPFRRGERAPARVLLGGALACGLALAAVAWLPRIDRMPPEDRQASEFARRDMPDNMARCHFDGQDTVDRLKGEDCWSRPGVPPTVVVWGDSHALAWQPFAWHIAEATGASAGSITMNACRPSGRPIVDPAARRHDRNCAAMNELAMDWLAKAEVDTLVIGVRWPWGSDPAAGPSAHLAATMDGIEAALDRLPASTRVLLMGPVPFLRRPAPTCVAMDWQSECAVDRAGFERSTAVIWRELEALVGRHPNLQLVDPAEYFCAQETCPAMRDGVVLYWDSHHISATAARGFAERFVADPARYTSHARSPSP